MPPLKHHTYSHTIGIASFEGRGFMNPVDLRLDREGVLFVLSRSNAGNKNVRVSVQTLDSEFLYEFGHWGTDPGRLTLPAALAIGPDQRVFVADEHMHNVTIFEHDGTLVERWGQFGSGPGEFNRPSGLAFDSGGNVRLVDHLNARIQTLTPEGRFISAFGTFGSEPGQFNFPWGIAVDSEDTLWVADWRNDRIQRFTGEGELISVLGESGSGEGQLRRPSGVHVDRDGNVYVADWGNERVQLFDRAGLHVETLYGDATLSKWCQEFLDVNPEQREDREKAGLFEEEKRFWRPSAVETSADGLVLIADSCRHRVQIYQRVKTAVPA